MHVGTADRGTHDLDQDVIDARGGFGDILQPQARAGFFLDERFHGCGLFLIAWEVTSSPSSPVIVFGQPLQQQSVYFVGLFLV